MHNQNFKMFVAFLNLRPEPIEACGVTAIAESGTDMGVLTDASCPSVQPTWFELSLKSERNRNKLHDQIEKSGKAAVVLSGELYGPPQPDPKLPEPFRSTYNQGWGHLGSFPMKVVVFHIDSVAPTGSRIANDKLPSHSLTSKKTNRRRKLVLSPGYDS